MNPNHRTPNEPLSRGHVADQHRKECLLRGDTLGVLQRSGWAHALDGVVVEGNKIGRTLGYPTANLQHGLPDEALPARGVYTAMVSHQGRWYQAMVNIGIRPTLNQERVTVEAHLFRFSKEIYGDTLGIHFLERIRDERRFDSLQELRRQLDRDRLRSLESLERMQPRIQAEEQGIRFRSS